jgi:hypothetical protein
MKKQAFKAIITGLFIFGSLEAVDLENYNGFLGQFKRKIFPGMDEYLNNAQSVQNVFDQVVPLDERKNWKEVLGKFGVKSDAEGCFREWIPIRARDDKWPERIIIDYDLKSHKIEKRQFKDIDEASEALKKNIVRGKVVLNVKKINQNEAIREVIIDNLRIVERAILLGDWLVCLQYEIKLDPEQPRDWEKTRDLWIERFNQVKFE